MSINGIGIEVHNGLHLQQLQSLEESACIVSDWLTSYAPNTKPKTAGVLISDFADSYYASIDGVLSGHIALSLFFEPTNIMGESESGILKMSELRHYGIGSLVVKHEARGRGIGSLLLDGVCKQVLNSLAVGDYKRNRPREDVLVSAIAASSSLPMFLSRGFLPDPELEYCHPYSEIDYDPLTGKTIVSRIFSL